jgi:hypothetical protein
LNLGSGIRAMMAARYGPSTPIMSQVAARGAQKSAMERWVGRSVTALG